jgi:LacI family transcriptional regulator
MKTARSGSNLGRIAASLGVSSATVSNALSGKGRVSAEMTERIRKAASELGYTPSLAGRALRTGRTGVLGLVLPDIANPLFPQIAQAIEHAASDRGYGVLIADSRGTVALQTDAIARLVDRGVDGVVVVPRLGTRIADIGCPVAVIDSPSTPGNTVSADHWQGGQVVGAHLVSLGHRAFLLIGSNPMSNVQNDRIGGLRSQLPAGCAIEVLWVEKHEEVFGRGAPLDLAGHVARGVTAIAAVSDLQALRALTELQSAGIRVPDAVSVTGFDDLVWSSVVTPRLTTVRMDMPAIAAIAIDALVRSIDGQADAPRPKDGFGDLGSGVPMQLIIRDTTAPPRRLHAANRPPKENDHADDA